MLPGGVLCIPFVARLIALDHPPAGRAAGGGGGGGARRSSTSGFGGGRAMQAVTLASGVFGALALVPLLALQPLAFAA